MRILTSALIALLLVLVTPASPSAVGTVVVTPTELGWSVTQYAVAWTSDAAGAVSANAITVKRGDLLAVKFVPSSGATTPTALYDATLVDANSLDILQALAADLSATASKYFQFDPVFFFAGAPGGQTLDLVISNAGPAKTGTVYIWVRG